MARDSPFQTTVDLTDLRSMFLNRSPVVEGGALSKSLQRSVSRPLVRQSTCGKAHEQSDN